MFTIEVTKRFYASHGLYDFRGEDEALHEHHWKVVTTAKAHELDVSGCAIDFHEVEKQLNHILQPFIDNCFNDRLPFDTLSPSAENIAKYLFEELTKKMTREHIRITRVAACEDEEHCAAYEE